MSQAEGTDVSLKKTKLNSLHTGLGARLVPFAGYELPVQYTGIRDEHLHTRSHASLFDISHMGQFLLTGQNVAKALEKLVPNRMANLAPGRQRYTVLLNEQGGVIDDLMISNFGDAFYLVVNGACKTKDWEHLTHHLDDSLDLKECTDRSLIALQGPAAAEVMTTLGFDSSDLYFLQTTQAKLCGVNCFISRSGYSGEDGFEISAPSDQVELIARKLLEQETVLPAGLGARDTLRLEAGLCLYGHELTEAISPVDAGLNWLISEDRLDDQNAYLGRDVIQRQLTSPRSQKRVGIIGEGKAPFREGTNILNAENELIGQVCSGTFSPTREKPIGMAYIDRVYTEQGTSLLVEVRNKRHPVTVTGLPFVPHRYFTKK